MENNSWTKVQLKAQAGKTNPMMHLRFDTLESNSAKQEGKLDQPSPAERESSVLQCPFMLENHRRSNIQEK